ncbi:MAG TPA: TolC family protein, partial [Gemmatimonadales bacterium]
AVSRALGQHPTVAIAATAASRARADVTDARSATLPRIALDASATQNQLPGLIYPLHGLPTPISTANIPVFGKTQFQGSASLNWTFFDFGGRSSRTRASRALVDAADASLNTAQQRLIAQVASAYLRVLTARLTLAAQDQQLAALSAEFSRTQAMLSQGKVARVEVLRADAAQARARAARIATAAQLEVARQDLSSLTAVPSDSLIPVALIDTAVPDRAAAIGRASQTSTEVQEATRRADAARWGASAARATRFPELRTSAILVDHGAPSYPFKAEWTALVGISYPLYTGGQRAAAIDRAADDERVAADQLRLAQLNVTQNVDHALASVIQAHAQTDALDRAALQSDTVAQIELTSLGVGSGTQIDYLDALAQALQARASLIEARHSEIAARIELARSLGELSPDWIARNLR